MPVVSDSEKTKFRCSACGRYFDTQSDLTAHEVECRAAKQSTEQGRAEMEAEDRAERLPDDQHTKDRPFRHGTDDRT
jgi:hypothetical protein